MDYSRPALADRLAAEFVLGTLRGPALRRMHSLLPAHPALRAAVADWQTRLMPLATSVPPVAPSAAVWARIEQRLFGAERQQARPSSSWWQRLGLWQGAAALATVAAVALGVTLTQVPPAQPPVVIVLQATPDAAGAGLSQARFAASLSGDGQALVLRPVDQLPVTASQALELWAVSARGGPPRSLGVISASQATTVRNPLLFAKDTAAFAVSVEPPGGSPTGQATGPIVSVGKLTS